MDTMIKRMLKKGSEQIVRQFEYYRVAVEQEVNSRGSLRTRRPINQLRRESDHSHFQYPMGAGHSMGGATTTTTTPSHYTSHTLNPILQNHRHQPYSQSHTPMQGAVWGGSNGCGGAATASINSQLAVCTSWSSSEHSNSSTRTLRAHDLEQLQDEEETFV